MGTEAKKKSIDRPWIAEHICSSAVNIHDNPLQLNQDSQLFPKTKIFTFWYLCAGFTSCSKDLRYGRYEMDWWLDTSGGCPMSSQEWLYPGNLTLPTLPARCILANLPFPFYLPLSSDPPLWPPHIPADILNANLKKKWMSTSFLSYQIML